MRIVAGVKKNSCVQLFIKRFFFRFCQFWAWGEGKGVLLREEQVFFDESQLASCNCKEIKLWNIMLWWKYNVVFFLEIYIINIINYNNIMCTISDTEKEKESSELHTVCACKQEGDKSEIKISSNAWIYNIYQAKHNLGSVVYKSMQNDHHIGLKQSCQMHVFGFVPQGAMFQA